MNCRHIYMLVVEHAKSEENLGIRKRGNGEYYEAHHILPKSLFPLWINRKSNKVLLTAREHFFCHQLLTKIYPCEKMFRALSEFMFRKNDNRSPYYKITSREYEKFRIEFSKIQSETHKGWFERLSEEERKNTINKWRESNKRTPEQLEELRLKRTALKAQKPQEKKKEEFKNRQEAINKWRSKKTKEQIRLECGACRNTFWWNDGTKQIRSKECPGEGFTKGRICSKIKKEEKE